jgi:GT2 family glycosyltransferase
VTPSVTIGVVPRERFVLGAESLASLFDHTSSPFELVIVDPATPERYRREIDAVLEGRSGVRFISTDRPLLPASSKNLVVREAHTEYVCLVENDVLFTDGWLEHLIDACESTPADVAAPLIREGRGMKEHFDRLLGRVVESVDHPGKLEIQSLAGARNAVTEPTRVEFVEQHCLLFRREVFNRIGPFDEELNTRDEIDLSLALRQAEAGIVLVPSAVINYVPPSARPEPDEIEFYLQRWDLERAARSRERIRQRWNLVTTPGDLGFVRYRNLILRLPEIRRALEELCRQGNRVVLIDNGDWFGTEVTDGLDIRPFPERDGQYWGFPSGDEDAVVALDRALADGATHVVVGWPAFWWFDHLPALLARLGQQGRLVVEGDELHVYDMQRSPLAAGPRAPG